MVVIVVAAATRRRLAVCESVMVMVAAFCQAGIDEAMPKSDSTTSIPESRPGVFAQQEAAQILVAGFGLKRYLCL